MMIYRGIIRSNIDYGCKVYGAAAPSVLKKSEIIQAKALRICSGAMKTTPTNALLVEMGETSLKLRRIKLSLLYWSKLRSFKYTNPTRKVVEDHWKFQRRDGRDRRDKKGSMMNTVDKRAQELGMKDFIIGPAVCWSPVPPWLLPEPTVDFSLLHQMKEGNGDPVALVNEHLKRIWPDFVQIFTDGSMIPLNRKAAIVLSIPQVHFKLGLCLPNNMSVFSTELVAILWALGWVEGQRSGKYVLGSDSTAAQMAMKGRMSEARSDLVLEILVSMYRVIKMGYTVGFMWVPAHKGIQGKEEADEMGKLATHKSEVDLNVMYGRVECKSFI